MGDSIVLVTPQNKEIKLTVSGFIGDLSMLTEKDAFGICMNTDAYQTYLMGDTKEENWVYFVQFKPHVRIQQALADIKSQFQLSDDQIAQNVKLLALLLQSNDTYMIYLYETAVILAVLVGIAGVLMISGSINSNVAGRTEFFGMMRCVGATRRQVIRFVRMEALNWCKLALPLGLLAAVVAVWLLCAILKWLCAGYFATMPVFNVSWSGLLAGAVVGLITVQIAAEAPAKKASRVSPLMAVSGNAGTIHAIKKPEGTKMFPVEIALGIRRAKGSRKNFILMTGSFMFSIILFLAFSTAIDFMHHAINPLKPYTPDISMVSEDNSCSILKSNTEKLRENPSVKKVYGRSFAYHVPVKVNGAERLINLISYEKEQFAWSKKFLLNGNIDQVESGDSVLMVYDSG